MSGEQTLKAKLAERRMEKSERSTYTPLDFVQWHEASSLVISPKFQRRGVWSRAARSYLIDSLLLEIPVPPIYLRVVQNDKKTKMIREVVDGQQRISAVLDFIDGKFSLSKNIESNCIGKRYDELTDDQRAKISQYSFICEVFYGVSDPDILKIFSRLNTNSVALNAQELRNGKYFGSFKRCVYSLALEHLEFWRRHRIFTEQSIARMREAEMVSELIILQMDGLQDKKGYIDRYYSDYDEELKMEKKILGEFRSVLDEIESSVGEVLGQTEFRRPPLFYSLFAAVYHKLYGMKGTELPRAKRSKLNRGERALLLDAVQELSDAIGSYKENSVAPKKLSSFLTATQRQTDNIRPRRARFEQIYRTAFLQ